MASIKRSGIYGRENLDTILFRFVWYVNAKTASSSEGKKHFVEGYIFSNSIRLRFSNLQESPKKGILTPLIQSKTIRSPGTKLTNTVSQSSSSDYLVLQDGSLAPITEIMDSKNIFRKSQSATAESIEMNEGLSKFEDVSHSSENENNSWITILNTPKRTLTPSEKSDCRLIKKSRRITDYVDILREREDEKIDLALSKFIFGCNLPFRVVESPLFKDFIKTIRPAYVDKYLDEKD
nr:unnamed protein product [Callosobruchus chinensis]